MGSETIISPTSFIAGIIHGQGFDLNIYSVRLFRNVEEVHLIMLAVLETSSKPRVIYQGAGTRHRRVNIRASAETGFLKKISRGFDYLCSVECDSAVLLKPPPPPQPLALWIYCTAAALPAAPALCQVTWL